MTPSGTIDRVITDTIEKHEQELRTISLKIHNNPELGNKEEKASELLCNYLEVNGFKVTRGVVGLSTAFIAEFSNGKEGRKVGFCSEYDALPGVGHACGHNLIAIAGVACALAFKNLLEQNLIKGSVYLFGTPAEETTSGKIQFVKKGKIDEMINFSMMLHPGPWDSVFTSFLALDSAKVEFFGRQSHAGMAPWEGVNALDALMQSFDNIGLLRQQTLPSNRIHGIITDGGKSANVIPGYASGEFYIRSLTRQQLNELKIKFEHCFEAAAKATGCTHKVTWAPWGQIDDVFQNDVLGESFKSYMSDKGVSYLDRTDEQLIVGGSTDFGNISYVVPGLHPSFSIGTTAANHTVEFAKAAATEEAHKNVLRAAICLAKTASDVFIDDVMFEKMVTNFKKGKLQ